MNTMKKLVVNGLWLAFGWLVAAGLCGTAWADPAAEEDFGFIPETGTITGYTGAGGDVEIPSQIGDVDVKVIGTEVFREKALTSVKIPASVTNISDAAFRSCESLTNVSFAAGSQLTTLCDSSFRKCTALKSMTIPASVTSIGKLAFAQSSGLENITFADGSQLKTLKDSAFQECTALTGITLPEGLTDIGMAAFLLCGELTEITVPASVTNISDAAFAMCSKLEEVTVLATEPPTAGQQLFAASQTVVDPPASLKAIKVPAGSVDKYKDSTTGTGWSAYAAYIQAMSSPSKEAIVYQDWNGTELTNATCSAYTLVTDTMETLNSGWYVVTNKVVIVRPEVDPLEEGEEVPGQPGLKVNGDVHLILADGAELDVTGAKFRAGIEVVAVDSTTNSLTIYGQENQTGKLTAVGGKLAAGIGGNDNQSCGLVTIDGGIVAASVKEGSYAAGIGGGAGCCGGTVTINGGNVTATGALAGAGIGGGGGEYGVEMSGGSVVIINGGTVTANGLNGGAGIGGGQSSGDGTVTINGGTVTANGGAMSAGIGSGAYRGEAWTVTINGGTVKATSYGEAYGDEGPTGIFGGGGAGIGSGAVSAGGVVTINGGEVIAISHPIEQDDVYQGEGIGAGIMAAVAGGDSGTLDLTGYTGKYYIYAGMDVTGAKVQPVKAVDFATVWHTNLYVQITTTPRVFGSGTPDDPWLVGANQLEDVLAYTHGTSLFIEGEGEIDGARPWLGDEIKGTISEAYVKGGAIVKPVDFAGWDNLAKIVVPRGQVEIYRAMLGDPLAALVQEVPDYLSFTARGGTILLQLSKGSTTMSNPSLETASDPMGPWAAYSLKKSIGLAADETIYFRRAADEPTTTFSIDEKRAYMFSTRRSGGSGDSYVEAGGNVMSLLDKTCTSDTVGANAFCSLFKQCMYLKTAPKLPATKLAPNCYAYMFNDCISLTEAPKLPATTLAERCYAYMFVGCAALTEAPELPATELAESCYAYMFSSCASLTEAPKLQAMTLAPNCYGSMFGSCASLTEAPELPAMKLAVNCYATMFYGCTSLTEAPKLSATELAVNCYGSMFSRCMALTEAPELPATKLATDCYANMFDSCTSLTKAPALQATELAESCYSSMFYGCTSLTEAPELPAMTLAYSCYAGMFSGCTALTKAPELPASRMVWNCYWKMFSGCPLINEISVAFTEWFGTDNWLQDVAETGTFKCKWGLDVRVDRSASTIPVGWTVDMTIPDGCYVKPWDVGTTGGGQPSAYTNGFGGVIVKGEGLPKAFDDKTPAPWAEATPAIATIFVPQGMEEIYKRQWPADKDKIVGQPDYLSFTAKNGAVEIAFSTDDPKCAILYSFEPEDSWWSTMPSCDLGVTPEPNQKIYVPEGMTVYFRSDLYGDVKASVCDSKCSARFVMSRVHPEATVEAGGNVMSLLDQTCQSKEVGERAFRTLFWGCDILTRAPKLPATKLAPSCYSEMFSNCTMLEAAPELPATEVAEACYDTMFSACKALVSAPELPAKQLKKGCYAFMFSGCENLNSVKVGFDVWDLTACTGWLNDVAETGTFVCSAALEADFTAQNLAPSGNTIPVGWRFVRDYLSFTAKGGDIKVTLKKVHDQSLDTTFELSYDGAKTWYPFYSGTPIVIAENNPVYIRKQGEAVEAISSQDGHWQFVFTGDEGVTVAAGGNVMSMLDPTCESRKIGTGGLNGLFSGCDRLVSAPRIDADTIEDYGCDAMFSGCTSLTTAPVIGTNESLGVYALASMFNGAKSLNEMTVGFTRWQSERTTGWVGNVAPFGVFRCPSELPIEVGESFIPNGWIVYKKFSIPAIEGLEHVVYDSDTYEPIAPIAVSQDGTKTYEVLAGDEPTYTVEFWDVDHFPVAGMSEFELSNLTESVEIGGEEYPLPERGVLLHVAQAPEHSKYTVYCDGEVFCEGDRWDLTTRVSSNAVTKVVYMTTDYGWAYAFEDGQPVTEQVVFETQVTEETWVSAPELQPDYYLDVLYELYDFRDYVDNCFTEWGWYPPVVQVEWQAKREAAIDQIEVLEMNPLPSETAYPQAIEAHQAFMAWFNEFYPVAYELKFADEKARERLLNEAGAEMMAAGLTRSFQDRGDALIAMTLAGIQTILSNENPPTADRLAEFNQAMQDFETDFKEIMDEGLAVLAAKEKAEKDLNAAEKTLKNLLKEPGVAAKYKELQASKDPKVQEALTMFDLDQMALITKLGTIKSAVMEIDVMKDVEQLNKEIKQFDAQTDDLRARILATTIPTYTLTVENEPKLTTYSVYTGETAQVTIADKYEQGNIFGPYVWETPVKVIYELREADYAFDDADSKADRTFAAYDAWMMGNQKVSVRLGYLPNLNAAYNQATNLFAAWSQELDLMHPDKSVMGHAVMDAHRVAVDGYYEKGVPVQPTVEAIQDEVEKTGNELSEILAEGYREIAGDRADELRGAYAEFETRNQERIEEIGGYGTSEANAVLGQLAELKAECEAFCSQANSVRDAKSYAQYLDDKQGYEKRLEEMEKLLAASIRRVSALSLCAEHQIENAYVCVDVRQFRRENENRWVYMWFDDAAEAERALAEFSGFIGQKYHTVQQEALYATYKVSYIDFSEDYMLYELYAPNPDVTACVVATVDSTGSIVRIGGVGDLDLLGSGEVKGCDIVGDALVDITYWVSKCDELYQNVAVAQPIQSGAGTLVLDGQARAFYAALGDCEIGRLEVTNEVQLILGKGCSFAVTGGIVIRENARLTIYSECDFKFLPDLTGQMTVDRAGVDALQPAAVFGERDSLLLIHGGRIDIASDSAGVKVMNFEMLNGEMTVTAGDGHAGIDTAGVYGDTQLSTKCRIEAGKLVVTGGAGAAAIGGNYGQNGGSFMAEGGFIRADALPTEDGKYGAGIGAGAGLSHPDHGNFMVNGGWSVHVANSMAARMRLLENPYLYMDTREPSVLIMRGDGLIDILPVRVRNEHGYALDFGEPPPGNTSYRYYVLSQADAVRAAGPDSTVGEEIWKIVAQIAAGGRIAVGEMTIASFRRTLVELGVEDIHLNPTWDSKTWFGGAGHEMVIAFQVDEREQVYRIGGVKSLSAIGEGSEVSNQAGIQAIGVLNFDISNDADICQVSNWSEEPVGDDELVVCGFTKDAFGARWNSFEEMKAEIAAYVGKPFGYDFSDDYEKSASWIRYAGESFEKGETVAVIAMIRSSSRQIRRIGVLTEVNAISRGMTKPSDVAVIEPQNFAVRAQNDDFVSVEMPTYPDKGFAWVWIRVCDGAYEAMDGTVNGLLGAPIGTAALNPLKSDEMPAVFGEGNWGLFTGIDTVIPRWNRLNEPMRGVIVFKVALSSFEVTGSEMAILTAGGVKNIDKMTNGQRLTNQYGEGIRHIGGQPFTVVRQDDDDRSLLVEPAGDLTKDEAWYYVPFGRGDKSMAEFRERLSAYLGATVGDLTIGTLGEMGHWPTMASQSPFEIPGDTEAVFLFKVSAFNVIETIGLVDKLYTLYDPGMSRDDVFGKTFITGQELGVTRQGDGLTVSVKADDIDLAERNGDRIVYFAYDNADVAAPILNLVRNVLDGGMTEVGFLRMEGLPTPAATGTFTADETEIALPAGVGSTAVFAARLRGTSSVIVAIGAVDTAEIADGETRLPTAGVSQARPFGFAVTRGTDKEGLLRLTSEARKVNEKWCWLAVPARVRHILEQQYESDELLLDFLRREMALASRRIGDDADGASEEDDNDLLGLIRTLQMALGDDYCDESLDEQLEVDLPADTELAIVVKYDRGTGALCGVGAVIGLDKLGPGASKQNQVDGRLTYATFDADGNRTLHETTGAVEPITELTASIGGGRWYLLTSRDAYGLYRQGVKRLTVDGEAHIIVLDGGVGLGGGRSTAARLGGGLAVNEGAKLNIYGQRLGNGLVEITGTDGCAAIGGDEGCGAGEINIHGGIIRVEPGAGAAAIGGGYMNGVKNGTVNLYGGMVMAYASEAAAIGGGRLGCGCDVFIGPAASVLCLAEDNIDLPGIGGCDGLDDGLVEAAGDNRIYLEAKFEGGFTYRPADYYLGENRRGNFIAASLATLSLPKDDRFAHQVVSMTLGSDVNLIFPGDDAYTYGVIRGDTVAVQTTIAAKDLANAYRFCGPDVFKFNCVQGDVAVEPDDLKIGVRRAVRTMDFTILRDEKTGELTLSTDEPFGPDEQLVWMAVPAGMGPTGSAMIDRMIDNPTDMLAELLKKGLEVGDLACDQVATMIGARNWGLVFGYDGSAIKLPADAYHVTAFKVYDAGKFAALSRQKMLTAGYSAIRLLTGRMQLVKVAAMNRVDDIPYGKPGFNQVKVDAIVRQPFTLARHADGTFKLALHGTLSGEYPERWGYATISAPMLEKIAAGQVKDLTVDRLTDLFDSRIGMTVGSFTIKELEDYKDIFALFEMSDAHAFTCNDDTAFVLAFRVRDGESISSLGYAIDDLQSMTPGGTDRRADAIDGEEDAPQLFVRVEGIPSGVRTYLSYSFGREGMMYDCQPDSAGDGFVEVSVPAGVDVTVKFEPPEGCIFRTKSAVEIEQISQDEVVDASFLRFSHRERIVPQLFNLNRNADGTFRLNLPYEELDVGNGEKWCYIALSELDAGMLMDDAPIGLQFWAIAGMAVGREVGEMMIGEFAFAMKDGYSGLVTDGSDITLPKDSAMLVVARCFDFTDEDGECQTVLITIGGCNNLQAMASHSVCGNELDASDESDYNWVRYEKWDKSTRAFVRGGEVYAKVLTDETAVIGNGEWYVTPYMDDVDIETLTVQGTANVIVRDQTRLGVTRIEVGAGATLNVYGQSERLGEMSVRGQVGSIAIGSTGGMCGTVNLHGIVATVTNHGRGGSEIGIGGAVAGGELNLLGANLTAVGSRNAIAGCALNVCGGILNAVSTSGAAAIADGISLKSDKLAIFAGDDPEALEPMTVADYVADRRPIARIVEYVNIIVPTVEHVTVMVASMGFEDDDPVFVAGEELPGTGWMTFKVERFNNAIVMIMPDDGYQLRSPSSYLFFTIDSDKWIPADAIVAAAEDPVQLIGSQPFSVNLTTDEWNMPCWEVKPIGELGPGEKWLWMSCDRNLAQMKGTTDLDDLTTEEALNAMLNMMVGQAPVGSQSIDMFRMMLPLDRSGVGGADAVIRLPADTDLVCLSKVYDSGTLNDDGGRYYSVTAGLATNLTALAANGEPGHNIIGDDPTDEEIEEILRESFPVPHEVTRNEEGGFTIKLQADMLGPVEIPDNLGFLTLDMNGYTIAGPAGVGGADGGNALVIVDSGDVGANTELTILDTNVPAYDADADIVGGRGSDGKRPGKGGAAIRVETFRDVAINIDGNVQVVGGEGGTALADDGKFRDPGEPGPGLEPDETRGDRAPGSIQPGPAGEQRTPWAKAMLDELAPANIAEHLPDGVTVVGNELWFWKRAGSNGKTIGFDFTTLDRSWIKDGEIRFVAGSHFVDQFLYNKAGGLAFTGADSAAVVVKPEPVKPADPEEKPVKPVLKAGMLGGKDSGLPDLGKHTTLASTGKSIFQSKNAPVVNGPLMGSYSGAPATWRNLAFTMLPGTVIEGNGGAINAANVHALTVADCAFANIIAGELGGAICAAGLDEGGLITNSTFTACSVSDANGLGGAIYATAGMAPVQPGLFGKKSGSDPGLAVVDCIFALNVAESGGAICTALTYVEEEPIALKVSGTSFVGNFADYNGGAIYAGGKVELLDAEVDRGTFFGSNEAGVYGGALAAGGTEDTFAGTEVFVGSNTVFACNKVENDWFGEALGGAINLPTNCALTVRNAMFTNNVAVCNGSSVYGVYGGAICTDSGCSNVIEKTYFVDNRAIAGGSAGDRSAAGGALSDVEGALTFVDTCVFDGNTVEGMAVFGAALDLEYDIESAVVNSTFRRSNVEAVSAYATPVVIRNCVIVDNGADADVYIEASTGYELTFTAYGKLVLAEATEIASSNNLADCVAAEVYRGETVYLATNEYNKVAALGYPQPGVTDIEGVEYGSKFWGTSMGAFETPAIYPVEELGFEITVDPLELAWTGMKVHPTSVAVTNPFTRAELTEGVDYTVSFENDVDSTDKAQVIVTGIGNYSGVATTNYWITSYLVKYYACEMEEGAVTDRDRPLETVELGSLSGNNVVAKIVPPEGYVLDPFHAGSKTNGVVSLYDSASNAEANGRLVLRVYYAKSSGGDDDVPDKYQRKITYKVVNGWWDNPVNGLDQTVWVTLYDGDGNWAENGTGTLPGIPAVGNTPFAGYAKTGVWYPATPTTVEMPITRESPSLPFFLYVYCAQPQGGTGRGGRGSSGSVTQADLDALKSHLVTKLTITDFAYVNGKAAGEARAAVVDELTGQTILDELLRRTKIDILATPSLDKGEWSVIGSPTTDGEGGWVTDERPAAETPAQMFFKLRLR